MKTVGVRALRENPGVLSQSAEKGELVLLTSRNDPISVAVPFDDALLKSGVHVSLAVKLYEEGALTLARAAGLAKMPIERFLACLKAQGINVVTMTSADLDADMESLGGK